MMTAVLHSAIFDSAILHSKKLHLFILTQLMIAPSWIPILESSQLHKKTSLNHFDSTLMMAAILNSSMLDSDTAILDSNTLLSSLRFTQKHSHSTLTLTHTKAHSHLPRMVPTICTKKFTHLFSLNLVMAAILNSAMLDSDTAILYSDTLLTSLRFTQRHSHSTLTADSN